MNSIRYALASMFYHKKKSCPLMVFTTFYIIIFTAILNIIDIEKQINKQIREWFHSDDHSQNFASSIHFYSSLYVAIFILLIFLLTILIYRFTKMTEQELLQWRIMGFSDLFIMRQLLVETLVPISIACFFTSIFLLLFQQTYTWFISHLKPALSNIFGLTATTLFSPIVLSEPNQSTSLSSDNTLFVSTQITQLSNETILVAIIKNSLLLFLLILIINPPIAFYFTRKSKKSFRR